jgi:hypothetical protein
MTPTSFLPRVRGRMKEGELCALRDLRVKYPYRFWLRLCRAGFFVVNFPIASPS